MLRSFIFMLSVGILTQVSADSIVRASDGRYRVEDRIFGMVIARSDYYQVWQHHENALAFPGEMSQKSAEGVSRRGSYRVSDICTYQVAETIQQLSPDAMRFRYDFTTQDKPDTRYHAFGTMIPLAEYRKNPVVVDGVPQTVSGAFRERWIKGKRFAFPLKNGICEIVSEKGPGEIIIKPGKTVMAALVLGFQGRQTVSATFTISYTPYRTVPVDLRDVCNMGFVDPVAGDRQGGWTDQGPENDLAAMKPGEQKLANISFDIIDPAGNRGGSCIAFRGKARPYFADSAKVKVPGLSGGFLYLLNGLAYPPEKDAPAGKVLITYDDGKTQEYILKRGVDTDNFWGPRGLENANVAWRAVNGSGGIGLFATRIPLRNQPVTALEFRSVDQVWLVVAASIGNAAAETEDPHIVISEGKNWVPLPNELVTEKGSIADFSGLLDAPAGKHGFVTAKDGRFVFEDGTPARFWGVNTCSSFHYDTPEAVTAVLDHIAACGYNAIRLHHFDNGLMLRKDPATGQDLSEDRINPERMAQLDFLLSEAKKRGIYITLDFFTLRWWCPVPRYGKLERGEYKVLAYFDDAIRGDLIRIAKDMMTHKNPLTGLRWADDPAIICINLINEATLPTILPRATPRCREIVDRAFGSYLAERGIADTPQNRAEHNSAFLEHAGLDFYNHMKRELRAVGVRIPLSDQNYEPTAGLTRHYYDYVDMHFYWNHPTAIAKNADELPVNVGNTSALAASGGPLRWVFPSAVHGKPMVASEWNVCYPNSRLFEGGIVVGAYAALQDFSGLMQFYFAGMRGEEKTPNLNCFIIGQNPLMRLSARCGALLFLRGDVKPDPRGVLVTERAADQIGSRLPIIARIRRISQGAPKDLPLIAVPGETGLAQDRPVIVRREEEPFLQELREHRVIPSNISAQKGAPIVSITGELEMVPEAETLKVLTAKSEALLLCPGQTLAGRFLQVRNGTAPAAFFASSMDGKALAESRRIVLMHLTDVKADGITFGDKEMALWEKAGDAGKLLLRRNTAELTLSTARPMQVFACDYTGKRRQEVPVRTDHGKTRMQLDNTLGNRGVLLYEIVLQ